MNKHPFLLLFLLSLSAIGCNGSTGADTKTTTTETSVDADKDGFDSVLDCDDNDSSAFPGADELCDGVDNDCDEVIDENAVDAGDWYQDQDDDGFGDDKSQAVQSCDPVKGMVADNSDCDDGNSETYPGALEYCDTIDTDCDGALDNDPVDGEPYYTDSDGDSYGDVDSEVLSCEAVKGMTTQGGDCDDSDALVNPGASEICGDDIDQDCDDLIDDTCLDSHEVSLADVTITGEAGTAFGYSVATGDFDGDGAYDVAVGSYSDHSEEYFGGAAHIFNSLSLMGEVTSEDAMSAAMGTDTYGYFGYSLAGVSDSDADGADELLVSAYGANSVFLFADLSGKGAWTTRAIFSGDTDLGRLILTSGDMTNDGEVDVLLGGDGVDDAGAVYLFAGPIDGDYATSDAHLTVAGGKAEGDMGTSGVLADMDGDGADDLILSVSSVASGTANIFLGSQAGVVGPDDADIIISGRNEGDSFGALVAVGDLNGDGANDLVVSAPGNDTLATNGGAVYTFFGPEFGVESGDAASIIYGTEYADNLGYQTGDLTLGDLNADGKADLIIGFYGDDSAYSNAGGAYIVYGIRTGAWTIMESDVRITGNSEGAQVGHSLAVADINSDGVDDVLVGSHRDAPEEGAAWIFWGEE